jgi:hypothetical protein
MNIVHLDQLEALTKKIEQNTASLDDYKHYEKLLMNGGLTHNFIYSYLNRAGFNSWTDFVKARQSKQQDVEASDIGALIGLGLGILLLAALFSGKK